MKSIFPFNINRACKYLIFFIIIIRCDEECPYNKPIYINLMNTCTLEYCTKDQISNNECIISNSIIKKQWINGITILGTSTHPIYPSVGVGTDNDVFFEANLSKNKKLLYSIEKNGRGFMDNPQIKYIEFDNDNDENINENDLINTYGNSALYTINNHKCFFKMSFYETIEVYDLVENKYTVSKLENLLGINVKSYYNSLLRTNDENIFIYAFITSGNHLAMQKIKFITNDASDCIEIIKTLIEDEKTFPKNSRSCLITQNQFIECLDTDENQIYYIRVYDIDLNFIKKLELEKNKSPPERAYYSYHQASLLKREISIFIYYTDISNNHAKPVILLKALDSNNDLVNVNDIEKGVMFKDMNYYFSDTENSFSIINDHYFVLATITIYANPHLIISLFNLFNWDRTLRMHYFDIPLKDLYDIDYYSNLYSFYYKDYIGVQFVQLKNNTNNINNNENYIYTMLLFSYGNSSDPKPIDDIFTKYNNNNNIYKIKLSDYITLENNIFCYALTGIRIISIPDPTITGISILKSDSSQLNQNEVITLDEILSITYNTNINTVTKGNYFILFAPTLEEPDYPEFLTCETNLDYVGIDAQVSWAPDQFSGRNSKFKFTVGHCYENCGTCVEEGININDQKCETCIEDYYFEENTKNCFKEANEGFFFDKNNNIFSRCYKNCKTCDKINEGENIHNCLSCKENYLLYNNTNCLNCKYYNYYTNYEQNSCLQFIPNGYYLQNNEYNIIEKCHQNCLTCNKGPSDDNNMNCALCDNQNGFYFLENSNNCYKFPYKGYYLGDNYKFKKCYYMCQTCSSGPVYRVNGEVENMNCDECINELGYFKINSNSKNCEFKEKYREYYNAEDNSYYPCYKDCLTCFDNEDSNLKMNCLTCDEAYGFFLYTKNGNNCLNCKSENKYINYEQNGCLDKIPDGYYLSNNISKQIDLCYSKCATCTELGTSDNDMKCNSCMNNYMLENGNCVRDMFCPNYFYYKSNINSDIYFKEKNCLDNNTNNNTNNNCPDSLPFYYTYTSECIDICPINLIFYHGCKISNIDVGLNKFYSLVKMEYAEGNLNNCSKIFKFSKNSQNFLTKIDIFPFLPNDNEGKNKVFIVDENSGIQNIDNDDILILNRKNYFENIDINLDRCIEILKNNSIINNETHLTMITFIIKAANYNVSSFYFELYDESNRLEKINLSICNEDNITYDFDLNDFIIPNFTEDIIDILPNNTDMQIIIIDDNIYNDECYVFFSEEGADVLVEDRIKNDIKNNSITNNTIIDSTDSNSNATTSNILSIDTLNSGINNTNISIHSCPTNCVLDKIDYITKKVYCSCPMENTNNELNNELHSNITNANININLRKLNPKRNTKSTSYSGSKSNIYVLKCIKNIPKYFKKNYILILFTFLLAGYIATAIIYCIKYRKKYIDGLNSLKIKKSQKISTLSNSYKMAGPPKGRQRNIINNSKSLKIMDSINDMKSSNNIQQPNQDNNNIKYNYNNYDIKKCITLPPEYSINSNNTDLDLVDYDTAINSDKRKFWEIFISISQKRQIFIFCFIKDHNILVLKINLFIFCLINYFIVNLFFFNNNVIHKIYIDKAKYNFGYQIKFILLASLISCIFFYIAKFIFTFQRSPKQLVQVIKCIDFSLIILILLFIFYWIYIGSFCSVFIKTQKHLIANFFITIIVCSIYELIFTIISCVMRKISLEKKKPKVYFVSQFFVSLKR